MKSKKNAFLFGSLAFAMVCSAQAAQIDVCGIVTGLGGSAIAPKNTTVGSGVRGGHAIMTNTTWTKNNEYFLTDRVFVAKNVTLTIEPGTKIYASTNDNLDAGRSDDFVGSLIATRGGRIVADGTCDEPIVFSAVAKWEMLQTTPVDSIFDPDNKIGVGTSTVGVLPGVGNAGLWGGLVVLGNAYILNLNGTTGNNLGLEGIEGFVPLSTPDDDTSGYSDVSEFGFNGPGGSHERDDNDDSGVYRYITIEHGGYEFEAGREINGLTLGGVGAGTVIDHIEVVANQDDGVEFFGGTVSASNLLMAYNQDDSFDMDQGFNGTIQFFFSFQNPGFADGGFEHDGIESTVRTGASYDAGFTTIDTVNGNHVPKAGNVLSNPKLYNGTVIGAGRQNTPSTIAAGTGQVLTEKGNHGFIFDDYYNGSIYNSLIDDFTQDLAFFRDNAKSTGAQVDAAHNTLGRFAGGTPGSPLTYITNTNIRNLFMTSLGAPKDGNSAPNTAPELTTYTRNTVAGTGPGTGRFLTAIDPRPQPTSPLLKANGATLQPGAPVPVAYRGAFGPGSCDNWAGGWTKTWASGVLQGGYTASTPPFADVDGDGISDTLEATTALTDLGFSVGVNNVVPTNRFSSLFTETSILELRTTAGVTVQKVGNTASLSVPVEKSDTLGGWNNAGNLTLDVDVTASPTKQFYRLEVKGAN